MKRNAEVAVVGYGIGGIATAIHLRALGLSITHFERREKPGTRGAGMMLHAGAQRLLGSLGILDDAQQLGARIRRIDAQSVEGDRLFSFDYDELVEGSYSLGIQRPDLHRLLCRLDSGSDSVVTGCNIHRVDIQRGVISTSDGKRYGPFELIVVADGANSALRKQVEDREPGPAVKATAALVGVLEAPEWRHGDSLQQIHNRERHVSTWAVSPPQLAGVTNVAFAMSLSPREAQNIDQSSVWKKWLTDLCPNLESAAENTQDTKGFHLFKEQHVRCRRWVNGRVVLLGDAAHAMSPLLGLGAQFALGDAEFLARTISRNANLETATQEFAKIRSGQLAPYQRASRWLTPYYMSSPRFLAPVHRACIRHLSETRSAKRLMHHVLC